MYSERTRPVMTLPSAFLATGKVMRRPVVRSPSQPLSTSVKPWFSRKPSPRLFASPPMFISGLRIAPRLGTSWSIVPLPLLRSTGFVITTSIEYSTMPRAFLGASWTSVMTALSGSLGSTSPDALPMMVSYGPTAPNDIPPKAGVWLLIWNCVILASAGWPAPTSAAAMTP